MNSRLCFVLSLCLFLVMSAKARDSISGSENIQFSSLNPPVYLPDGTEFKTWEPPSIRFKRTLYVNPRNPKASDSNDGSKNLPFKTITRAADLARPGDRIIVSGGIYRERITPARGGVSPELMISYEAEPGAMVLIKGSEIFTNKWSEQFIKVGESNVRIWKANIDRSYFPHENPFEIQNVTDEQFKIMDWAHPMRGKEPFVLVRGLVFQDGRRLKQVGALEELGKYPGSYWVDVKNQVLYVRLAKDLEPEKSTIEITTRSTLFAPSQPGLGFIRIKGFVFEQIAGPFPWEQVGAISTTRGHHWIIEYNTVREANGVGIDVGIQHPHFPQPPEVGFHIVRNNVVTDCGICGIAGLGPGRGREFGLLIEGNVLMRNAWHDAERLYETGAIKTHNNINCVIQKNIIEDVYHGPGIWMDWDNRNSRCCKNLIINANTIHGGIFVEASQVPNLVDNNIIWNVQGNGIYEHDSASQIFVHNIIGNSSKALRLSGKVTNRKVSNFDMSYGKHIVKNNLLVANKEKCEFLGEPSQILNNVEIDSGVKLNIPYLQMSFEKPLTNIVAPFFDKPSYDFFGKPFTAGETLPGAFAVVPAENHDFSLFKEKLPADMDWWLRERLEWFQDLKFGFMMHWGAYSQWGCIESWPLVEEDKWARPDDLKAWVERGKNMEIFKKDYFNLPKTFNPVQFNPSKWAKIAKEAGMKYVVFTTKHHDGFAMFDTKFSDYKITSPDCPFSKNARSNVVREVFNSFSKEGFGIGAYFSKADWHHPDYWSPDAPARTRNPNYDTDANPQKWNRFVEFVHNQIQELVTEYGHIDILWLDAGQVRPPKQNILMERLAEMARGYQPHLIIVDRTVGGKFENYRTPEQEIPERPLPYVWETCMTMGNQWSFNPNDNYKSTRKIIHLLVEIVTKGGNLILNVGPDPTGKLPEPAIQRMKEIGEWMNINGEAIYSTRPIAPFKEGDFHFTRKNNTVYAIYLVDKDELPNELPLSSFKPAVNKIRLLGYSKPIAFRNKQNGIIIEIPDSVRHSPPCKYAFVFAFQIK